MTTIVTTTSTSNGVNGGVSKPFVRIVEQPAKCAIRFRYECEGRSAGSIPGINATPENKTFPTIQVCNFRGKAVVVVSCVTKEPPFRPHPHNLVGKEGCKKGVCTLVIDNNPDMTCTFTSLGIQCVKRNKIEESLKLRETIKVDPFRTGFSHRTQASSIDLNCLRLCFQVFIEQGPEKGKFTVLPPVVSDAIYDKKAMAELIIVKLSHYSAPCTGGKEIILLCDRVAKDDIQVRFIQESNTQGILWEGFGEFTANDVHKQVAISLRTPKYYDENISQPITVQIQLRRPSDGCLSLPRSFQITPRELDPDGLVRKRHKRLKEENYNLLQEYIQLASGQTSNSGQQAIVVQPQPSCSSKLLPIPVTTSTGIGGVTIKTELPSVPVVTAVVSPPRTFASTGTQQFQQQQYIQPQSQHSSPPQHVMSDSASMSPGQQQYLYQNNRNTINNNNEDSNAPSQYTSLYDHHHAHHQTSPQHQSTSSTSSSMAYALAAAMAASSSASSTSASTQPMMVGGDNGNVTIGSPTHHHAQHHAHFQQQQPSPCPSQGSYPSPIHSPATNTNINTNTNNANNSLHSNNAGNNQNPVQQQQQQQQHQEIPNEVMERFDSLDIDSSELIPDLDFNSNTMLSLMMDTSSGLSLSDSFSDMANNNNQQQQSFQMNGTSSLNDNESNINPNRINPYGSSNILGLANTRAKLKLNLQTSTLHNISSNHPNNNSNATLDTPLIEMLNNNGIAGGTYDNLNNNANNSNNVCGTNHQPMFSALDLDNNNIPHMN